MKTNPLKRLHMRRKMHHLKTGFASIGSNPFTDWQIVFFLSSFIAIGLLAFAALTAYRVENGTLIAIEQKKLIKVTTIDRKSLTNIIDYFETKAVRYESLKTQRDVYVDPSF